MTTARGSLFDETEARLPLFEDLPEDILVSLAAAGLGRGLLTAALRSRLRKAGFVDMGQLALASPADLAKVRKFGPVRIAGVRARVLEEIARIRPGARALHTKEATADRRMIRLDGMPVDRLPLDEDAVARIGCAGGNCGAFALRSRLECLHSRAFAGTDLDRVVTTLTRFLLEGRSRPRAPIAECGPTPAQDEARLREERGRMLRERDREWDEAAPAKMAGAR